ncbi:MAG: MATE family efflux transporter [Lentisphaerae bacterium]|nr:MATE family efflux transporter [Lentisphaerota bacterium]
MPPSKANLTSEHLLRALFSLATPMLVQAFLQNLQNMIDLYFVGNLGSSAVAAVSASGNILFLLTPVLMGASMGTIALVSRFTGEGNHRLAAQTAGQSVPIAIFFGIIIGIIGQVFAPDFFRWMRIPEDVTVLGPPYLRIILFTSFTMFVLFLGNAALQGAGDAWTPMKIMALANVINATLDPLLIYGIGPFPQMGVNGAAWATAFSQAVAALLSLHLLVSGKVRLNIRFRDWLPNFNLCWRITRIGVPSSGQMFLRSLMNATLYGIVAPFGTSVLAGYSVGTRINVMILMPTFAFGNAAAAMVGQNLGARKPERAVKAAWTAVGIGAAIMVIASLLLVFFAPRFIAFFAPEDPEAIRIGAEYFHVEAPFYICSALSIILSRSLAGAGASVAPFVINAFTLWGVQVPTAIFLSRHYGTIGIWSAMAITQVIHAIIVGWYFSLGRWKHKKV